MDIPWEYDRMPSDRVIRAGAEIDVDLAEVHPGDLVRVRPGDKVPVDSVIVEGGSAIDESTITGESIPVDRAVGDEIIGATLNTPGTFIFRATRVGSETALARIVGMVRRADGSKAPIQRLARRSGSPAARPWPPARWPSRRPAS
ncbi:MAG: hypothetical protein ABI628_12300 [Chloroflexota bacterium]